ncbi:SDR family NAD(P)-dependent oxidoreductase [Cupriavidus sp. CP313]
MSSLTVLGAFERTAYAAAKAAQINFSRSWALELATTGIAVNTVAPGPTETELFRKNSPPGSLAEKRFLSSTLRQSNGTGRIRRVGSLYFHLMGAGFSLC